MSKLKDQLTVDKLKNYLENISVNGYGDMPIFLGEKTPLLENALGINFLEKKVLIRNRYYDRAIADNATKLKETIGKAISDYILNCGIVGMDIKEIEEQ